MRLLQIVLTSLSIALIQIGDASADAVSQSRDLIEQELVSSYANDASSPGIINYTTELKRGNSVQPIRIVHRQNLVKTDRVLIISLDDGAREVFPGADDTVVIGIPFADRK